MAEDAVSVDLEHPLYREERPWGQFSVYLMNGKLGDEWVRRFTLGLSREYEGGEGILWRMAERILSSSGPGPLTVKIITVKPRSRLSLQFHSRRAEKWLALKGQAFARLGEGQGRTDLVPGKTVTIPKGMLHRLESVSGAEILEVAEGYFDEMDVVRIEDDYQRASRPGSTGYPKH